MDSMIAMELFRVKRNGVDRKMTETVKVSMSLVVVCVRGAAKLRTARPTGTNSTRLASTVSTRLIELVL